MTGGKIAGERRDARPAHVHKPNQRSEFRVQGSGFRVQGSGFRVQGSGCRVHGAGFRVQDAGFRVQGHRPCRIALPPECHQRGLDCLIVALTVLRWS